ncbi:uncharacterized protein LOC126281250 [Schistocerca gregaria]|uniref:uncharacterized protein LOC126281250 n=1 Tax=Schistocerca gregaria TaxID=7010 RepID=UPI00211DF2F4|nr:uncharacterized protein LOC126281250 [Schistocerca gregaria]
MAIIENCFIYSGKKAKPDCESGNAVPKMKRDRWRRSIRITKRVVAKPAASFFLSCFLWTLFVIVLSAATIVLLALLSPFPLRPSCLILWKTQIRSCDEVRNALLVRLEDWMSSFSTCSNCSRYQVVSVEPNSLWLWHRSEWRSAAYEADISLFFSPRPNNTCHVLAQCRSRAWLWPLDGGASFCALTRLAADSSFLGPLATQATDDPVCTQFSSAACPRLAVPAESPHDPSLLTGLLEVEAPREEDWLRTQDRAAAS